MRARKAIKRIGVLFLAGVFLVGGALYVQASRIPANYRPARLTVEEKDRAVKSFWQKFFGEFNDGAQDVVPYTWTVSEKEINAWLAAADEIGASIPSGEPGSVYQEMERLGLADPAVSFRNEVISLMVRSKRHDKILSADLAFDVTVDRKLLVRLVRTRVGRLTLPSAWVQGRIDQLKNLGPPDTWKETSGGNETTGRSASSLTSEDIASALTNVLGAIDSAPIAAELVWPINKKTLRIEEVQVADGVLKLRIVPLNRTD